MVFICPRCGAVSHNPHDAAERYCARCHVFVDDEAELERLRKKWPPARTPSQRPFEDA